VLHANRLRQLDRAAAPSALTGRDGGKLGPKAQLNIQVAGGTPWGAIEDAHMNICHMIGYYFMDCEK